MLKRRSCFTCVFWRAGASPSADQAALDQSYDEMGACENIVPQVFIINEGPVTLQPTTHATRCCAEWATDWPDDDPDDPDDGEPHPAPSRVRNLFPIQPAPIAA